MCSNHRCTQIRTQPIHTQRYIYDGMHTTMRCYAVVVVSLLHRLLLHGRNVMLEGNFMPTSMHVFELRIFFSIKVVEIIDRDRHLRMRVHACACFCVHVQRILHIGGHILRYNACVCNIFYRFPHLSCVYVCSVSIIHVKFYTVLWVCIWVYV